MELFVCELFVVDGYVVFDLKWDFVKFVEVKEE